MGTTRRVFLAATAAAGLTPPTGAPGAADAAAPGDLVATPESGGIERLARFGGQSSDQWPCVSLGADPDEYLAAHGDGIGLLRDREQGRAERKSLGFSRLRVRAAAGRGFEVSGYAPGAAEIAGYSPEAPDDYKPNALFHDQENGDLHCFIARGTGRQGDAALANRRRAWLISSADRGRSWNTGALPPLGRDPAFDAAAPDGLVPVGACNHRDGSVHADGYVYLYFNRQGNPKSFDLYPEGRSRPELKPVYCGRAEAPPGRLPAAERARHFADPRSWSFRTARGGWSGPGDLAAADPVHDPDVHMGKHFLVWRVPALDAYVAAKTHSLHRVWLGVADEPWGPFREVMDRELGETANRGQLKFTAQLLPSPGIAGRDGTVFPLIVSGAPYYDGLGLARIRFSRAR